MSITFRRATESAELKPKLIVFGVGGAGGNAVNNMMSAELEGVEFIAANTDSQALLGSKAQRKIQLGAGITQGLGAGSRPEVGAAAAEASLPEILDTLSGAHMVFITAGMGGGTGTGAAPIIARAAREMGILTVGVITKPFQFEGPRRMRVAEDGIAELQSHVDTLIIIPNQNLFRVANEKTTFAQAFAMADEVLHSGVRGITDLMVIPGLMNLDFADVKTVMSEMGKAMMGTGEAEGEKRALEAAEAAISNPLLDDVSMKGARGVLIHITGGMDLTLFEVDEAANRIRNECDADANIKVGSTFDPRIEGKVRVSVVATGIEADARQQVAPQRQQIADAVHRAVRPQMPQARAPMQQPAAEAHPVHAMRQDIEQARITPQPQLYEAPRAETPPLRRAMPEPRVAAVAEPMPDLLASKGEAPRRALPAQGARSEPLYGYEEPKPKRSFGASFFDRVTGRSKSSEEKRETYEAAYRPAQQAQPVEPQVQPQRMRFVDESVAMPAQPKPAEPVKPETSLFREQAQDDQLEIPAFLRRQAN